MSVRVTPFLEGPRLSKRQIDLASDCSSISGYLHESSTIIIPLGLIKHCSLSKHKTRADQVESGPKLSSPSITIKS